jgi:ribosomal protein L33
MEHQICNICSENKPLTLNFYMQGKNKRNSIEILYWYKFCKTCYNKKAKIKNGRYKRKNRDLLASKQKIYYQDHIDESATYHREWYKENKTDVKQRVKNNVYKRRSVDPIFRMREAISANIRMCIKKNHQPFDKFISYTIQELKSHLEKQFEFWMTWNNYGTYRIDTWDNNDQSTWTWQIDHIIPHSKFKYNSMHDQEFKDCWALSNLRPYSAKQNLIDSDRK